MMKSWLVPAGLTLVLYLAAFLACPRNDLNRFGVNWINVLYFSIASVAVLAIWLMWLIYN